MGWGRFEDEHILMPANDAITVGLFLAHREHTAGQRFNLEWNQRTSERIDVVLQPKEGEMTPVHLVEPFTWLSSGLEGDVPKASLTLDLDHRGSTLFNGQARSFFLPVSVIQRLLDGLRGRPTTVRGDVGSSEVDAALEEPDLFLTVVHASFEAFRSTDQPVYLQRSEDWGGHLSQQFTEQGFGRVEVLQSVLDGLTPPCFASNHRSPQWWLGRCSPCGVAPTGNALRLRFPRLMNSSPSPCVNPGSITTEKTNRNATRGFNPLLIFGQGS